MRPTSPYCSRPRRSLPWFALLSQLLALSAVSTAAATAAAAATTIPTPRLGAVIRRAGGLAFLLPSVWRVSIGAASSTRGVVTTVATPAPTRPRHSKTAAYSTNTAESGGGSFMEALTPTYIEPEELLELLQAKRRGEEVLKLQIVDVRDDDYEGGRLPGAVNVPSEEWGDDERIDALVEALKAHELVVFHCMKSQVRGPFCAKRFLARLSMLDEDSDDDETDANDTDGGKGKQDGKDGKGAAIESAARPRVCVLRYGYEEFYFRYRKEIGMIVPCDVDDDEDEEEDEEEDD